MLAPTRVADQHPVPSSAARRVSQDGPQHMNSGSNSEQAIDRAWVEEMLIRRHLAELALDFTEPNASPTARAFRLFITHHVPLLVEELFRLRPELKYEQSRNCGLAEQPH